MKTLAFVLAAFSFCSSIHLQAADPWEEQPIIKAVWISAGEAMGEYELWAEDWKKEKRDPINSAYTINVITESTLIPVQMALEEHPNPRILEACLIFLGTKVQPEFDDMWKARILEMAYLDKALTKKVDELLKSKNLPSLEERAKTVKHPPGP